MTWRCLLRCERRRWIAVLLTLVLAAPLVLPAPSAAQTAGAFLEGAERWTESDCAGEVSVVVGSDARAQSDIYSAVTLAGALGTDCVILAGPRNGYACVIRTDYTLYCWGDGTVGTASPPLR